MFAQIRPDAELWRAQARCNDGAGSLLALFFSEQLDDIARAKQICRQCEVREDCLAAAVARHEPWGVWGGELFWQGKVLSYKRKRGRPPKVRPAEELAAFPDAPVFQTA